LEIRDQKSTELKMTSSRIDSEKINYFKSFLPNIDKSFDFKVVNLDHKIIKDHLDFIMKHFHNLVKTNVSEVPFVRDPKFYLEKNEGYQVYQFTKNIKEQCEELGEIFKNKPGYKHTCAFPTKDLRATCKWADIWQSEPVIEIFQGNENYYFTPHDKITALYGTENQIIPTNLIVPCRSGKCEIPVPDSIVIHTFNKKSNEISDYISGYKIDQNELWSDILNNKYRARLNGGIQRAFYFSNCFCESLGPCIISEDDYILSVVTIEQ